MTDPKWMRAYKGAKYVISQSDQSPNTTGNFFDCAWLDTLEEAFARFKAMEKHRATLPESAQGSIFVIVRQSDGAVWAYSYPWPIEDGLWIPDGKEIE